MCQATGTGSLGQRWILEKNANGTFRLHPATDMTGGMSLDVANGSADGGTNIQIWQNNGLSSQNFGITKSGDGYAITTEVTSHQSCLDVNGASKSSGANVIQWTNKGAANQIWYFEEAQWPSSGSGSSSGNSGSGNTSSGTSNISSAIDANGYPDQLMEFVSTSDGAFVTASSTSANAAVKSSTTASTANRWKLIKKGGDYYQIINAASGYALAPTGNKALSGASVVVTGVADNNAQYWKIAAVKTDCNGDSLNYKLVNYANTNLALTLSNGSYQLSSYSGSAAQNFRFNFHGAEGFAGYSKNMSGKEKASVIGGALGSVVYVSSVSDLQKYASGSTAYTIVINGNLSTSNLTKVTVGKNKTFIGKFGAGTYSGYPRMTIANNYFYNNYTRAPGLMCYGYFHCYNNYVYGFNLGYTPYTNCTIYSEKNYFDKGSYGGRVVDDYGVGAFTDNGSVLTSSVSNLKTGGTSWRPSGNYGYATRSAADARS